MDFYRAQYGRGTFMILSHLVKRHQAVGQGRGEGISRRKATSIIYQDRCSPIER